MRKNRWLAVLLALTMTLCFAVACGNEDESVDVQEEQQQVELVEPEEIEGEDLPGPNEEEKALQEQQAIDEANGIEDEAWDG